MLQIPLKSNVLCGWCKQHVFGTFPGNYESIGELVNVVEVVRVLLVFDWTRGVSGKVKTRELAVFECSSRVPSEKVVPPYHSLPPSFLCPCTVRLVWCSACWQLYPGRYLRRILKNIWSSTHFANGPIPWEWKRSVPASASELYTPDDGEMPKHVDVSMQKASSPILATAPVHWEWCKGIVRYASATSRVPT